MSPRERQANELNTRDLFDARWYLSQNPDVASAGLDPASHYFRFGMAEGRWPNRYFDPRWYASESPDATGRDQPALLHYVRQGEANGRRPHPHFDPAWYRRTYEVPQDQSALGHFLARRHTGAFAPCAELYAVAMLPEYRLVKMAGDPFARYLDDMARTGQPARPDPAILDEAGVLDPNFYLINGSDVQDAGMDPILHYCQFGWKEARRPNIYFDSDWYILTNPPLARLQVNPLMHYVLQGEPENRRPVPYFDPGWYRQTHGLAPGQNALGHFLAHRFGQRVSPTPDFDVRWYVEQHTGVGSRTCDPFMHYLQASTLEDNDPSPRFNAREYRRRHLGRATRAFGGLARLERDNPLVHHLATTYLSKPPHDTDQTPG